MLLRFIKKYAEILAIGGFLAYWLWDAKFSASFSEFNAKDWMSVANTFATLILSIVAIYGINSWRREYKEKQKIEATIDFAERGFKALDALRYITNPVVMIQVDNNNLTEVAQAKKMQDNIYEKINEKACQINEFSDRRYRYQILVSPKAEKICSDVIFATAVIKTAINSYVAKTEKIVESLEYTVDFEVRRRKLTPEQKTTIKKQYERRNRLEEDFYHRPDKGIGKRIQTIHDEIEKIMKEAAIYPNK